MMKIFSFSFLLVSLSFTFVLCEELKEDIKVKRSLGNFFTFGNGSAVKLPPRFKMMPGTGMRANRHLVEEELSENFVLISPFTTSPVKGLTPCVKVLYDNKFELIGSYTEDLIETENGRIYKTKGKSSSIKGQHNVLITYKSDLKEIYEMDIKFVDEKQ